MCAAVQKKVARSSAACVCVRGCALCSLSKWKHDAPVTVRTLTSDDCVGGRAGVLIRKNIVTLLRTLSVSIHGVHVNDCVSASSR